MTYTTHTFEEFGVRAEISVFASEEGRVQESHVMLHVEPEGTFLCQMKAIYRAEEALMHLAELKDSVVVMKRYFLSDSTNQQPLMREEPACAVSFIQQPPLDGSKLAVWLYLERGAKVYSEHGMVVSEHGGYKHLWKMGMHNRVGDSAAQTTALLTEYEEALEHFGANLADHCIRTWFFVRDVDTQYAGMVKARTENFTQHGLTQDTHYITSTGIGGLPADPKALVQLGAYALIGFFPQQQHYLYAPTHLNPTYEYGVTFERGTVMEYGDRRHVIISGTASINNRGEVVHVGDIEKQTLRMIENVGVLLAEGETTFEDVMQIVVYLRDMADYPLVKRLFEARFPKMPCVFTLAPVCRPTWLIEMECIAVKNQHTPAFQAF